MYDHLTDAQLLAWLLWGEAEGEPPEGKLAVAHVVLNRAMRPRWWGHDVRSVILAPAQFDGLRRVGADFIRFPSIPPLGCMEIAILALAGYTTDPANGATHFYAEYIPKPWPLPEVARIGRHIFCKED